MEQCQRDKLPASVVVEEEVLGREAAPLLVIEGKAPLQPSQLFSQRSGLLRLRCSEAEVEADHRTQAVGVVVLVEAEALDLLQQVTWLGDLLPAQRDVLVQTATLEDDPSDMLSFPLRRLDMAKES